ncbi:hypothetical protein DFH07DRAFT_775734 [Mycena maculata]|uniref:Uncharacterized protein n=1 Tax=Mycena maculata TaxID=230809 RepID=A0AAD7IQB9_9AGAR|nr:hypothetical protein DFH07DRAFT_775734 [Mycena maculata]
MVMVRQGVFANAAPATRQRESRRPVRARTPTGVQGPPAQTRARRARPRRRAHGVPRWSGAENDLSGRMSCCEEHEGSGSVHTEGHCLEPRCAEGKQRQKRGRIADLAMASPEAQSWSMGGAHSVEAVPMPDVEAAEGEWCGRWSAPLSYVSSSTCHSSTEENAKLQSQDEPAAVAVPAAPSKPPHSSGTRTSRHREERSARRTRDGSTAAGPGKAGLDCGGSGWGCMRLSHSREMHPSQSLALGARVGAITELTAACVAGVVALGTGAGAGRARRSLRRQHCRCQTRAQAAAGQNPPITLHVGDLSASIAGAGEGSDDGMLSGAGAARRCSSSSRPSSSKWRHHSSRVSQPEDVAGHAPRQYQHQYRVFVEGLAWVSPSSESSTKHGVRRGDRWGPLWSGDGGGKRQQGPDGEGPGDAVASQLLPSLPSTPLRPILLVQTRGVRFAS